MTARAEKTNSPQSVRALKIALIGVYSFVAGALLTYFKEPLRSLLGAIGLSILWAAAVIGGTEGIARVVDRITQSRRTG